MNEQQYNDEKTRIVNDQRYTPALKDWALAELEAAYAESLAEKEGVTLGGWTFDELVEVSRKHERGEIQAPVGGDKKHAKIKVIGKAENYSGSYYFSGWWFDTK